ncbi:unnamed protein product [Amoebophrya sp. A120]|nr:unnamed protein product [Amoebophrya sp. A120]|eukprot:GSA120T00008551001.1
MASLGSARWSGMCFLVNWFASTSSLFTCVRLAALIFPLYCCAPGEDVAAMHAFSDHETESERTRTTSSTSRVAYLYPTPIEIVNVTELLPVQLDEQPQQQTGLQRPSTNNTDASTTSQRNHEQPPDHDVGRATLFNQKITKAAVREWQQLRDSILPALRKRHHRRLVSTTSSGTTASAGGGQQDHHDLGSLVEQKNFLLQQYDDVGLNDAFYFYQKAIFEYDAAKVVEKRNFTSSTTSVGKASSLEDEETSPRIISEEQGTDEQDDSLSSLLDWLETEAEQAVLGAGTTGGINQRKRKTSSRDALHVSPMELQLHKVKDPSNDRATTSTTFQPGAASPSASSKPTSSSPPANNKSTSWPAMKNLPEYQWLRKTIIQLAKRYLKLHANYDIFRPGNLAGGVTGPRPGSATSADEAGEDPDAGPEDADVSMFSWFSVHPQVGKMNKMQTLRPDGEATGTSTASEAVGWHAGHTHSGEYVSGVYYVSADNNSGVLRFADPRGASPPFGREVLLHPRSGEVVFFPSWLQHSALPSVASGDDEKLLADIEREQEVEDQYLMFSREEEEEEGEAAVGTEEHHSEAGKTAGAASKIEQASHPTGTTQQAAEQDQFSSYRVVLAFNIGPSSGGRSRWSEAGPVRDQQEQAQESPKIPSPPSSSPPATTPEPRHWYLDPTSKVVLEQEIPIDLFERAGEEDDAETPHLVASPGDDEHQRHQQLRQDEELPHHAGTYRPQGTFPCRSAGAAVSEVGRETSIAGQPAHAQWFPPLTEAHAVWNTDQPLAHLRQPVVLKR